MQYEVEINGRTRQVNVHRVDGHFVVALDGHEWRVDAARIDPWSLSLLIDGESVDVSVVPDQVTGQLSVGVGAVRVGATLNGRRKWGRRDDSASGSGPQKVIAPMPGKVVRVLVRPGDAVAPRQTLVVIEAMKMENELRASRAGVVSDVQVKEGQSVDAGALLLVVAPA